MCVGHRDWEMMERGGGNLDESEHSAHDEARHDVVVVLEPDLDLDEVVLGVQTRESLDLGLLAFILGGKAHGLDGTAALPQACRGLATHSGHILFIWLKDHILLANPERFWGCVLHG